MTEKNVFGTKIISPEELWTPTQREVVLAFGDAVIPEYDGEDAAWIISQLPATASDQQREVVTKFARSGFGTNADESLRALARRFSVSLSPESRQAFASLFSIIGTGPGCFAMTGSWGPFQSLSRQRREEIITAWTRSSVTMFRKAASSLRGMIVLNYYRYNQEVWEALGYPIGPANDWQPASKTEKTDYPDYKFENDTLPTLNNGEEIFVDTEVLVIGSGSGGGVAAASLAKKGAQVLVVDKGIYQRQDEVSGDEGEAYNKLYDGEGIVGTEDGNISVLIGSTFGGGSTVNWSASLKPRNFVRRQWAEKFGIPYYASPAFTADLNYICGRMGASTANIQHNKGNSLLALGSARAGMPCEAVPQNTGGHVHYCGKCHFGCPSGHKQGGVMTWLKDAAEHGAKFMTQTKVQRILFDKSGRKAVGAKATVNGRPVTIRASRAVICAGGSIQTPALLLRTPELKFNKQIGKNLHLHPTCVVTGYYDFPINPWEGSLLTMVNNATELVDLEGWGCKIEVIATSPAFQAGYAIFDSAKNHKARMLKYSHSLQLIVISRDRDGGDIILDSEGEARMRHPVTKHSQASLLAGILAACDVHMAAGCSEVSTNHFALPPYVVDKMEMASSAGASVLNEPQLEETVKIPGTTPCPQSVPRDLSAPSYVAWKKQMEKIGTAPLTLTIGSAHQMSSCRMSAHASGYWGGACDPEGRVRGVKGLYVADASILPEASGVNPMITTMTSAHYVARNIAKDLGLDALRPLSESTLREARL